MQRPFLLFGLVWLTLTAPLMARVWTDQKGGKLEADIVKLEGANVILRIKGKETPVAVEKLSADDQTWVTEWQDTQTKKQEAALAESLVFGDVTLVLGKRVTFELPLLPNETKYIKESTDGELEAATIKATIAVPLTFDPRKETPILLVSTTTGGKGSSVEAMQSYVAPALEKQWIVIAADGPNGKPIRDSVNFRYALQQRLLREINTKWPGSENWPMAHAGFSGGGGYASFGTVWHCNGNKNLIGLLLQGTSWTPQDFIRDLKKSSAFRKIPVFFSIGDNDTVATPKIAQDALAAIKQAGSRKVREEHFPGDHSIHIAHIGDALTWFMEQHNAVKK